MVIDAHPIDMLVVFTSTFDDEVDGLSINGTEVFCRGVNSILLVQHTK